MKLKHISIMALVLLAACGGRLSNDEPAPDQLGTTSQALAQPGTVIGISAGQYTAFAVRGIPQEPAGARVTYSAGTEGDGVLGNGVNNPLGTISTPVSIGTTGCITENCFVAIASGNCHTIAMTNGGGLFAWGCNSQAQLGTNDTTDRLTPVQVVPNGSGIVTIGAGGNSSYYSTATAVMAAGQNDHCQIGNGTCGGFSGFTPVSISHGLPLEQISSSGLHTVVLDKNLSVIAWGKNNKGQASANGQGSGDIPSPELLFDSCSGRLSGQPPDMVATSAETTYWSGSLSNGACSGVGVVRSWGGNSQGQLGNGGTDTLAHGVTTTLQPVGNLTGDFFSGLVASQYSAYAIWKYDFAIAGQTPDHKAHLYVVGADPQGQLGRGNQTNVSTWTSLTGVMGPSGDAYALVAGFDAAYYADRTLANGAVFATGGDAFGQLGIGAMVPSTLFTTTDF